PSTGANPNKSALHSVGIGALLESSESRCGTTTFADSASRCAYLCEISGLDPDRRPTAAEVRAEVWMALIHGAKGIVYFVHEFEPHFREDAIFRYPDIVEEITNINRLIKSLAPVLNSPTISGSIQVHSTTQIATMVKVSGNTTYIFAVAMQNSSSVVRIDIPNHHKTDARVIGENRNLAVIDGSFEDRFEGYGVHLYQIE